MNTKTKIPILLFFLTAIVYGQKHVSEKPQYTTKVLSAKNDYQLPKGTAVSILKKHDGKTNTDVEIAIPISGNAKFDRRLRGIIEKEKANFTANSSVAETRNRFEAKPVSVYISEKIISVAFEIATQNGDAAHGGIFYCSYNYDVAENKEIKFGDYFAIASGSDEDSLTRLINESVKSQDAKNGETAKWDDFGVDFRSVDFTIRKDTVTFNLGFIRSYAQGFLRAEVDKSKLEKFISGKYR